IARKWKIGQKNTNNGALILIAVKDHKYRVEVGYGLEGVLPDGYIGNLERNIMTPYFAKNNFFDGLNLAIANLGQEISKDYKVAPNTNSGQLSGKGAIIYVLLGVGIFVVIVVLSIASGNTQLVIDILWFIFKIVTLAALFRGGGGGNSNDDDIGGGGDFGGGGSSGKW
ncbi:MAG TPA: TPM domain-containing protein, partial [Aquella sp.]|nr:TPM domain-containing protein [Aquella sp.]